MSEISGAHEILTLIELRFGSPLEARKWFEEQPLSGFGNATAKQLVEAGRGAEVLDFISAVDAGIHS